jgi:hypothetical protein
MQLPPFRMSPATKFQLLRLSAVTPAMEAGLADHACVDLSEFSRTPSELGCRVLTAAVVLCVLGSLAVLTMAAPRVYYAMAQDGLFFAKVAVPHPRFGTPSRAIALQIGMSALLVLLGSFSQIPELITLTPRARRMMTCRRCVTRVGRKIRWRRRCTPSQCSPSSTG